MNWTLILLITLPAAVTICLGLFIIWSLQKNANHSDREMIRLQERLSQQSNDRENIQKLLENQQKSQQEQRQRFDEHQINSLKLIQDSLQKAMSEIRTQVSSTLTKNSEALEKRVEKLTIETEKRLKEISKEVDKQLTAGFEKTTATFTDVVKRLAIIDQAQKKITELSSNVVSLQAVLSDKKSRGAFGEVQLASLIRNMIPETHFSLQHTLSNGKRPDCVLFLPKPTGDIAIDAKFPLESYRLLSKENTNPVERKQAETRFRLDIRKHISDIADKYIIENETSDGAMMFIPAEAVFAEIHAHFPELVDDAHRARVWLVSPTTMMAILTTARAVLKDEATRKQVHIIQEHLVALSKDFSRFQKRMDSLAKHIDQASQDVDLVHKSSQKITSRFSKIEQVELQQGEKLELTDTDA